MPLELGVLGGHLSSWNGVPQGPERGGVRRRCLQLLPSGESPLSLLSTPQPPPFYEDIAVTRLRSLPCTTPRPLHSPPETQGLCSITQLNRGAHQEWAHLCLGAGTQNGLTGVRLADPAWIGGEQDGLFLQAQRGQALAGAEWWGQGGCQVPWPGGRTKPFPIQTVSRPWPALRPAVVLAGPPGTPLHSLRVCLFLCPLPSPCTAPFFIPVLVLPCGAGEQSPGRDSCRAGRAFWAEGTAWLLSDRLTILHDKV